MLAMSWWRGQRLQELRRRRQLTQVALAKRVQVHPITIARWEGDARTPSMAALQRLAKALGVPVTALLE
jgi:transcriptional regulator with XRE-family HTH domain